MTPHMNAKKEDIAKTVLMPGDPLRAKFFADKYLENARLVSDVRGMTAYTGTYKGKDITVMAHGMGMPSIGIYVYELYKFYDVENIIRFGSCASYIEEIKLHDIILAPKAWSTSEFGRMYGHEDKFVDASKELLEKARSVRDAYVEDKHIVETIPNTSLWFYKDVQPDDKEYLKSIGVGAGEMEIYALYVLAKYFNRNALGLIQVVNHVTSGVETSSEQREQGLTNMMEYMLDIVETI